MRLSSYDVHYSWQGETGVFRCQAEDEAHALEQCENAYPNCCILSADLTDDE